MTSQPTSTYWVVPQTLSTVLETELVNRMTEVLMNAMEQGATEFNGSRSEPADYFDEIIREFQCVEYNNKDTFGVFKGGSFVELNHKTINRLKGLIADIDKQLKIYISRSGQDLVREFVGLMFDHDKFQSHITVDWMEAMVKVGMREGTNKPLIHKLFKAILTYIGVLLSGEYEFDTAKLEEGLLGMSNYKPVSISSRSRSRSISTKSEPPKPKRVVRKDPSDIYISDDDDDKPYAHRTPKKGGLSSMIKDCHCKDKHCHHEYPRYEFHKKTKRLTLKPSEIELSLDLFNPGDTYNLNDFTVEYAEGYIPGGSEIEDTWFYYDLLRVLVVVRDAPDKVVAKTSSKTQGGIKISTLTAFDSLNSTFLFVEIYDSSRKEMVYERFPHWNIFKLGLAKILPRATSITVEPYIGYPDNSDGSVNISKGFLHKIVDKVSPQVIKFFDEFIDNHFCSFKDYAASRSYKKKFIKSWIARPLMDMKDPRSNILLVLIGDAATGKTSLAVLLQNIYGPHLSVSLNSTLDITGKFNSSLMNKYFVVCDDAESVDKTNKVATASFGKIKTLISSETINIEMKGKDQISLPNCANFLFTSNDPKPVGISDPGFARRIAVFRSNGNGHTGDEPYWKHMRDFFYESIVVDGMVEYVGKENITPSDETVLDHLFTYLVQFEKYEAPEDIVKINATAAIIPQTNDYINISAGTGSLVNRFKFMMTAGMFKKWLKRAKHTDNAPFKQTIDGKEVWVMRSGAIWSLYTHYLKRTGNISFAPATKAVFDQQIGGGFFEGNRVKNIRTRIIPSTWDMRSEHDIDDEEFNPPDEEDKLATKRHRNVTVHNIEARAFSKRYVPKQDPKEVEKDGGYIDPESEYCKSRDDTEAQEESEEAEGESTQIDTSEPSVSRAPSERKRVSRSRSRQ